MSDRRPETGVMQFGEDWPGIFIRGDNAGGMAALLRQLLKESKLVRECPLEFSPLVELEEMMRNSNFGALQGTVEVQWLKPYPECVKEKP